MKTIQEYRLQAGISKNRLCKLADVDYHTLTKAEKGEPILDYNARKIVDALSKVLNTEINFNDIEGLSIYQAHTNKK